MKLHVQLTERERLDKYLLHIYPDFSRSYIQKYIEREHITVNGKPATIHHWLKNGDAIEGPDLTVPQEDLPQHQTELPTIIASTDEYLVVMKPAGLLVHPTDSHKSATLVHWLIDTYPDIQGVGEDPKRPGIIHRLDKDVGGLILVARTNQSYEYLKGLFQSRAITKKYLCLVHGRIQQDEGEIDTPLERNKETGRMVAQTNAPTGKESLTLFKVLRRFVNYTLLDVRIVTGRTHQIRTHLYSIGHSIVGDQLYRTRDIRKKKKTRELNQPFLYAYYLGFKDHDGVPHEYQIELPQPLREFLETCT